MFKTRTWIALAFVVLLGAGTARASALPRDLAPQPGAFAAQLSLLGSDDYFVGYCQGDHEVYVARIYQTLLNRAPRPDEVRFWVNQFQTGDRQTVLRRFSQTYNVAQLPSTPAAPSPFPVPALPDVVPPGGLGVPARQPFETWPVPAPLPSPRAREVIALADQLIAEADQYIAPLQGLAPYSRSTAPTVLIRRLQNMQRLTIDLRQAVANGAPGPQVERAAHNVLRDHQQLLTNYSDYLVKEPRLASPWVGRIDDTVRRILQVIFQ